MRIAYILFEPIDRETGVNKKIKNQVQTWISYGHEVKLFVVYPIKKIWEELAQTPHEIFQGGAQELLELVKNWQPDIVYYRFLVRYRIMKNIMTAIPTVIEINSDDTIEQWDYRMNRFAKKNYWKYAAKRMLLLKASSGIVTVSEELKRRNRSMGGKPIIAIGNGIDMKEFSQIPAPANSKPTLAFIGKSTQKWHNTDKFILMANHFPGWDFHMVGFERSAIKSPVPSNITFHGHLPREKYESVLAHVDVAIGTLSLHNNKMNEASPLKVREYLAYGLPVINGCIDTDFPDGAPFILQLPNTPTNVAENLDKIEKFVNEWKGKRVERKNVEHLDVNVKEKERLLFFSKVIST